MRRETRNLLSEIDKLVDLLDRKGNLLEDRINFYLGGKLGKGKYMDSKVLPPVEADIQRQSRKLIFLMDNYFDKNG